MWYVSSVFYLRVVNCPHIHRGAKLISDNKTFAKVALESVGLESER